MTTPRPFDQRPSVPPRAYLVDVYDTVLSCDFRAHAVELPALAGVSLEDYRAAMRPVDEPVTDGRLSMRDAMAAILTSCGRSPDPGLVDDLVRRDQELLIEHAHLHEDTVPFLEAVRSRGVPIALVSNCADNTRALLDAVGLVPLVDAVVLSCEVGHAKPSAAIYRTALEQLGVTADAAVFVDDQAAYCAGAVAVGMRAVQITRTTPHSGSAPPGTPCVQTLTEIPSLF